MRAYRNAGCWFSAAVLMAATAVVTSANAADVMATKTLGDYKVELHVLPAEPFFTKDEVVAKQVKDGMEIEGGAAPIPPDDASKPNHHLVVHVFDKSGKALTDANVTLKFAPAKKSRDASVEVPVVVMQAVGQGAASTHYGNNVSMPNGRYQVTVTVNGKSGAFNVTASDKPSPTRNGKSMGNMKM